ncbi:phosphatase PAP2 family protein [Blastococcus sp. URHD0036]|uniref:phosphatase PAP2 family protein n=1 Tax=Blastococcus sp. URHD0036 TaxID=1380356 RepID=UPI00068D6849|nr:phosphatase PAP2 family protein [Blastococcus sp. URHD0036]
MTDTVAVSGARSTADAPGPAAPETAPGVAPARRARLLRRPTGLPWWFEFVLLYGLYKFYSHVRNGVGEVHDRAYANADWILRFEDATFLAWERWLNDWAQGSDLFAAVMALQYATWHLYLTAAVLIWLYRYRRAAYRVASTIWMATTFFALVGFYLLPTAPPRLMQGEGFVDVMRQTSSWGWWPTSGSPAANSISNQFAAMPSLHCAWAAWCGIVVFLLVRRTWVRVLAVLYPLMTFMAVMATGNHYLLDVVAGLALLAAVGAVVLLVARLVRTRRAPVAAA